MMNTTPLVFEASSIGLAPGEWPKSLLIAGRGYFSRELAVQDDEGDVMYVEYRRPYSQGHPSQPLVAHVYND